MDRRSVMKRVQLAKVTRAGILAAIALCDAMGRDAFLERYGFRRANRFHLRHHGRSYDSKAILGVAFGLSTTTPAGKASEFSGGAATAERVFTREGFTMVYGDRGDSHRVDAIDRGGK